MKIAHIGIGNGQLTELPKPPAYLTDSAKKHYKKISKILKANDKLKETFLGAIEIYSEAMSEFEFALREIRKKNKVELGTGYIQQYTTGATNITTEMVIKKNAEQTLFKCFKQFGLDPLSEKALIQTDDSQLDLFGEFKKAVQQKVN